jgi:hypothetical protein
MRWFLTFVQGILAVIIGPCVGLVASAAIVVVLVGLGFQFSEGSVYLFAAIGLFGGLYMSCDWIKNQLLTKAVK